MKFILTWIATAVGVAAAVALVPGIYPVGDNGTLAVIFMALSLALINTLVKPIAKVLSLPLTILTLGIFYLILNALLLNLASWLSATIFSSGVMVDGFGSAFFGAIIIAIVTSIMDGVLGNKE